METQIIVWNYLALVGRKRGDVTFTRVWAERTLPLAQMLKSTFYMAVISGSLAWVAWRKGDLEHIDGHRQSAQAAMAQVSIANPMEFMFIGSALALAVVRGDWAAAITHTETLLAPTQQKIAVILSRCWRGQ